MKNKTTAALCAADIRKELKKEFPDIKFTIKSQSYSGGNSVRISWFDGPPSVVVREFTDKYQYGNFNGMEDIYEYSNNRTDLPHQVKYVFASSEISPARYEAVKNQIAEAYGCDVNDWEDVKKKLGQPIDRVVYQEIEQPGRHLVGVS